MNPQPILAALTWHHCRFVVVVSAARRLLGEEMSRCKIER